MDYKVGDKIQFESPRGLRFDCIIVEAKDGEIIKIKAADPHPKLIKHGFIIEGEDYILTEWKICIN